MFLFYFFLLDQRQEKKEAQPVHAWCKGNIQTCNMYKQFSSILVYTTEAFPDILIKIISQFLLDFLFLGVSSREWLCTFCGADTELEKPKFEQTDPTWHHATCHFYETRIHPFILC